MSKGPYILQNTYVPYIRPAFGHFLGHDSLATLLGNKKAQATQAT